MLRCERLSKRFGGLQAVADLTVQFDPPSIVAIVGPNGAGKTTLLDLLTGVTRSDSGQVWLDSREIGAMPMYRIAKLGVTRSFQELCLAHGMSVLDNVRLALPHQSGESLFAAITGIFFKEESANHDLAMDLIRGFGLEEVADQLAREISYGQQKLLSIACCLATGSKILLLDEPVAGVHPELAERILEKLRAIGDGDRLIIFVEHDLPAVEKIADRVIVMDEGRIIADGEPGEILQRPEILEAYVG